MKSKYTRRMRHASALGVAIAVALGGSAWAKDEAVGATRSDERTVAKAQADAYQNIYIVGLRDAPLALADTTRAMDALPRNDKGRLDVHAPEARAYVEQLRAAQDQFLASARSLLGREVAPIAPEFRFQHAFNGMVLRLSGEEAARLGAHPAVALVEPYTEYPLDTDVGPALIGAPGIWSGANTPGAIQTRGEGVVIGIIDSGANGASPSYAATDLDGYTHTNPLGSGNFLGWCNPSNPNHNPSRDVCNDKMIGGWDFTDAVILVPPVANFEAAGFEDENGHGSHTASTAGGNRRNATLNGVNTVTSGVAPRANLVIYDVCYTNTAGNGLCPNVSTLAAINQTVADGVIDVINYSISGGAQPWLEANSLAFLGAHNAGIYVAASAGNSGPGPATLGHHEPWVSTTGASTHNRIFGGTFNVTAPGTPTPAVQNIPVSIGAVPWPTTSTAANLVQSPFFANGATDGCNPPVGTAYPAGTFTGAIAVLRLDGAASQCASGQRRTNAVNAGAVGVIFVDVGFLNLGANNTSWSMRLSDWNAVSAYLAANPGTATASVSATAPITGVPADVMAGFTSRGPSNFSLLKPDLTGPGVSILASVSRWNRAVAVPGAQLAPPAQNNVGLLSGTSMSSPHHAGSAALLRALNRSWTPTQLKTALVTTTTTTGLVKEDGVTASDPFDRGSGRIDLTRAAKAGLVMNETGANFTAANPANGGNPANLNLPSFQNMSCVGTCTFPRTVSGTRAQPVTWNLSITGLPAGVGSVSPATFSTSTLNPASFTVSLDSLQLPNTTQTFFGELVLTPSNPSIPTSRMAIAVRKANPDIDVTPVSVTQSVGVGGSVVVPITVANVGNPTLTWSVDGAGLGNVPLLEQPNNGANGVSTGFYLNQTPAAAGTYNADDATPTDNMTLRTIRAEGFMTGTGTQTMQALAQSITWRLYSDSAGVPAGNPDAGAGGEIWSCNRTPTGPNSAGLTFNTADGAQFTLDASAATGCAAAPALTANTKYWVSVTPNLLSTSTGRRWAWFRATVASGSNAKIIQPVITPTIPTWQDADAAPNLPARALRLSGDVQCGAPWLSFSGSGSLGLGGQTVVNATLDATSLAIGTYRAFACISTGGSDPATAKVVVPITLEVRANGLFLDGFEDPI
jgi:hypothetical protein